MRKLEGKAAVITIRSNVTAGNLDDLDRPFDTVKRKKGDTGFDLIVRGTLFTVQKALPLLNDALTDV